jgi:hypothetical protein
MSLTVFLAMCVLGVDFLIYFFFKLLYGEKHRIRPHRLPPEYYKKNTEASSLYRVPARKDSLQQSGRVVPMPKPTADPAPKRKPHAHASGANFAENLAYRRITVAFAQTNPPRFTGDFTATLPKTPLF